MSRALAVSILHDYAAASGHDFGGHFNGEAAIQWMEYAISKSPVAELLEAVAAERAAKADYESKRRGGYFPAKAGAQEKYERKMRHAGRKVLNAMKRTEVALANCKGPTP